MRAALLEKLVTWTLRRQQSDGQRCTIRNRRIYILPNRNGALYAAMIVIMLLGSINYGISMGYFLTFLMAGVGSNAMWRTHRNLHRLMVAKGHVNPVFAGQLASFSIEISNPDRSVRPAIGLRHGTIESALITVPAAGTASLKFNAQCPKRGLCKSDHFSLHSQYPMGIFRAWTWIALDMSCVVYPRPVAHPFLDGGGDDKTGFRKTSPREGNDDFAGLQDHRPGDPLKHIAWKAMAKQEKMLTKHFCRDEQESLWLDWNLLPHFDMETRLSILCHWILESELKARIYGLRLPGIEFAPQRGEMHKTRCLEALALFNITEAGAPIVARI